MARKLELKITELKVNGRAPEPLLWGEMALNVLSHAEPGRGVDYVEMKTALAAMAPIEEAMAKQAKTVTLTEDHYRLLRDKAVTYKWGLINRSILDFLDAVANAPEIT